MEMTYTEYLEQEIEQLKKEIEQLKKEKATVYKWGYSLEKDYKLLKGQIDTSKTSRLIAENNRLNEICIYWENEHDKLLEENEHLKNQYESLERDNKEIHHIWRKAMVLEGELKQENTQLKHKNKQQAKTIERLITIITDEHYN